MDLNAESVAKRLTHAIEAGLAKLGLPFATLDQIVGLLGQPKPTSAMVEASLVAAKVPCVRDDRGQKVFFLGHFPAQEATTASFCPSVAVERFSSCWER